MFSMYGYLSYTTVIQSTVALILSRSDPVIVPDPVIIPDLVIILDPVNIPDPVIIPDPFIIPDHIISVANPARMPNLGKFNCVLKPQFLPNGRYRYRTVGRDVTEPTYLP